MNIILLKELMKADKVMIDIRIIKIILDRRLDDIKTNEIEILEDNNKYQIFCNKFIGRIS